MTDTQARLLGAARDFRVAYTEFMEAMADAEWDDESHIDVIEKGYPFRHSFAEYDVASWIQNIEWALQDK